MDIPPLLKLYPELCLASLKSKRDKELVLWYQARALNGQGDGKISCCELVETLSSLGYYSKRTLYRILRQGNGVLWTITDTSCGRYLYLKSLRRVATLLDVGILYRRPVQIPPNRFVGRANIRALFYGSFFRIKGDQRARPISRVSIAKATFINRRQQLRYEVRIPLEKQTNVVIRGDKQLPVYNIVEGKSKTYCVQRRLGNTYQLLALETKKGMASSIHLPPENGLQRGGRPTFPRRFFSSAKQFLNCATRDSECLIGSVGHQREKECAQWALLI